MKKVLILLISTLSLAGCVHKNNESDEFYANDYGAFLGRSENNVTDFNKYKYVSCELDEFTHTNIDRLSIKGVHFLAYLNVGSLEDYRDYYDDYKSFTFKDYENWPDERWIDVRNASWQDKVVEIAQGFLNDGAFGVYMDNVDVFSIAKEDNMDYLAFGTAIKNIISRVNDLGLKVMVNGGAEYFDDMNDLNDNVFDSVWAYHQEEVFSLIDDYQGSVFTTQSDEDKSYYQEIATMMNNKGKEIFLLEYTTDDTLKAAIKSYCDEHQFHYYISNNIELI